MEKKTETTIVGVRKAALTGYLYLLTPGSLKVGLTARVPQA